MKQRLSVNLNGQNIEFNPGLDNHDIQESGVSIRMPLTESQNQDSARMSFNMSLKLNGSKEMYFLPLGKETQVFLKSTWKDPSFDGAFLPDSHHVSDKGFDAQWKVFHLNRNYAQKFRGVPAGISESAFGVKFLIPVDNYQKHIAVPNMPFCLLLCRLLYSSLSKCSTANVFIRFSTYWWV